MEGYLMVAFCFCTCYNIFQKGKECLWYILCTESPSGIPSYGTPCLPIYPWNTKSSGNRTLSTSHKSRVSNHTTQDDVLSVKLIIRQAKISFVSESWTIFYLLWTINCQFANISDKKSNTFAVHAFEFRQKKNNTHYA